MSERQIDKAIDAAVRDLMDVDADPAFRARVVERLRRPKPRGSFWRPLSMAAAALVVIIGVVVMRGSRESSPINRQATAPTAQSITPSQTASSAEIPRSPVAPAPVPSRTIRRNMPATTHAIERGAIVATVADVDDAISGDAVAADNVESQGPITSIELTPITHTPIVTPEVAIAPLASPVEIVIAPLDPHRERN
jgi:hypothetical protein